MQRALGAYIRFQALNVQQLLQTIAKAILLSMMKQIGLKRLTDRDLYTIIILEIKKAQHTYRQKTNRSQDAHEFAKKQGISIQM